MKDRKAIERRIEVLLDETYHAGKQAREIAVNGPSDLAHRMSLEKLEYAGMLAVEHLKWVLADDKLPLQP